MQHEHNVSLPNRRRIRLDEDTYRIAGAICSITIAVKDQLPVFRSPIVAQAAVDTLSAHAERTAVPVYAYCVMPDHVHLVTEASPTCDIITFVGQYKNLAQRASWQCGVTGAFWQRSFWDHFLRDDEDLGEAIAYVLNNPVRRGLAEDWRGYRYAGSLVYEL
ncbi:MAG: transposase [Chloroflexi bacterium]|nr:transposase [Chloroflexota bacterium]